MRKNKMPDKISNICIRWQTESPFFAEFLLRFIYEENESCPTSAIGFNKINHKLHFIYNSKFLDKLNLMEVEGLAVHEIMHILHRYDNRIGDRINEIFNISQDACINRIIKETTIGGKKLELPKGGVDLSEIEKMGYAGEPISELIYDFLYERADKIVICSTGAGGKGGTGNECPNCGGSGKVEEGSDGEGSGGSGGSDKKGDKSSKDKNGKDGKGKNQKDCPVCGGSGKIKNKIILRTTDDHTKNEKKPTEIEKAVIEELINSARTRSWGNVSGNIKDEVNGLIQTKKIPWQRKLAVIMSKYVHQSGNIYENTWSKRNRRSLPLPGIRKLSKKILVTVDTSGSISREDLKMFFGQIEKLIKDYSKMTLIQWDTRVSSTEQYKKGAWKKIEIKGRGGTDPQDLYDNLHKNHSRISVVVNFTDSFFDWNFNNYGIPSVWAVVNNPDFVAPFGKTVIVESKDGRKRNDNLI